MEYLKKLIESGSKNSSARFINLCGGFVASLIMLWLAYSGTITEAYLGIYLTWAGGGYIASKGLDRRKPDDIQA